MKTKKRFSFFFGLISSLFLAVGLTRAADTLDPMATTVPNLSANAKLAPNCTPDTWGAVDLE